jgi:hypothetical protein
MIAPLEILDAEPPDLSPLDLDAGQAHDSGLAEA